MNRNRALVLVLVAAAGAAGAGVLPGIVPAGAAYAQATKVTPYQVVVTTNEPVPLRCGDSTLFYPVAMAKPGDMLNVEAETNGWLQVAYPPGLKVYVKPDEVSGTQDGKVTLVRPSRLRAPNVNAGWKGSFYHATESELPAGTVLTLAEEIKGDDGKVVELAVAAPAGTRAWISREAVRRVNPGEAPGGQPAPTPAPAPPPSPTAETPAATATTPPGGDTGSPVTPPPGTSTTTTTTTTTQPVNPPRPVPTETVPVPPPEVPMTRPADNAPAGTGEPGRTVITGETTTTTRTTTTSVTNPLGDRRASLEELTAMYNRVRQQPPETAELDAVIGEFERVRNSLGSSPSEQRLAKSLQAYIDAMNIRRELRDARQQAAVTMRTSELLKTDVGRQVVELERQRVYSVIGKLVRSTVYDGDRAPLLYRVTSPEPGSARTLGYLVPDPKFDLVSKLEQVVGIVGDLRPDDGLRTNLIIPKRVDVVSLAPIVVSPDIPGVVVTPGASRPGGSQPPARRPQRPGDSTPPAPPVDLPAEPVGPDGQPVPQPPVERPMLPANPAPPANRPV